MQLIRILRNAGLSIPAIRSIINKPETTWHYFNQRMKAIQKEQKYLEQLTSGLDFVMDNMPINPQFHDILELSTKADIPSLISEQSVMEYDIYDNMQVNRLLWGVFLPETPLTEYQEFLWEKLNKMTCSLENEDGYKLSCFFHSQSPNTIERFFAKQASHIRYVAELKDCEQYAEEMKSRIAVFLDREKDIEDWKNFYELLIKPQVRIYDGEIGKLAFDMSPLFVNYCNNTHESCNIVYKWLKTDSGKELYTKILNKMQGYVDLETCHHGELEIMANLRQTVLGEKW